MRESEDHRIPDFVVFQHHQLGHLIPSTSPVAFFHWRNPCLTSLFIWFLLESVYFEHFSLPRYLIGICGFSGSAFLWRLYRLKTVKGSPSSLFNGIEGETPGSTKHSISSLWMTGVST